MGPLNAESAFKMQNVFCQTIFMKPTLFKLKCCFQMKGYGY